MGKRIRLLHSAPATKAEEILSAGLRATSEFDDLDLEMRRGVVFCWLREEDDKMWGKRPDHAYFEVKVDAERCRVAEMDFASVAMMYRRGEKKPKNRQQAARLLAEAYRVTSVPLSEYVEGTFFAPEVLVKGDIDSACVRPLIG